MSSKKTMITRMRKAGGRAYRRLLRKKEIYDPQELAIIESGIFDEKYYIKSNKDLDFKKYDVEPIYHFLKEGIYEFRSPNKDFDTRHYVMRNFRKFNLNPIYHYVKNKETMDLDIQSVGSDTDFETRLGNKLSKTIDIINMQFFDLDGKVLFKGGAERYVYDLAVLVKKMGYKPRILQAANKEFKKKVKSIEVIGCETGQVSMSELSKFFDDYCKDSRLVIASPLELASNIKQNAVIGINHGIYWDNVGIRLGHNSFDNNQDTISATQNVNACVCVDTNFINWMRTCSYGLAKRLKYVPNYFDENIFQSNEKHFDSDLTFTYSRRIVDYRGWGITRLAFTKLLKEHKNVKLRIVGQPHNSRVKKEVKKMINMFPGQCSWEERGMDEMAEVYQDCHVALIPTLWSEGTSLSCIEAMASGSAVIATNVGGLPNLVIDGFNGLLIDPSEDALFESCQKMIQDRDMLKQMAKNSMNMAQCFTKTKWEEKWTVVLEQFLVDR